MQTTPAADALRAVAARETWLQVHAGPPPAEPGWVRTGAALADRACLLALVGAVEGPLRREHPAATPAVTRAVASALLLLDWSWALACVGAGSVAATGVLPDLSPDSVWLRFTDGRLAGVAVTGRDVTNGPGVDDALRDALARAAAPLHAALRQGPDPLLRVGPRTAWGALGDAVATALRLQDGGDGDALAAAERLLADAPASWGRHGWTPLRDRSAREHLVRPRSSCCLWYRLPGETACTTCPRLTRDQLLDRLDALPEPLL